MRSKPAKKQTIPSRFSAITDSRNQQTRIYTVKGRVQGVWFRDSTRREALQLGLCGYAKNLPDGDVEVLAAGEESALDRLGLWLHEGPPMASVSEVQEQFLEGVRVLIEQGCLVP